MAKNSVLNSLFNLLILVLLSLPLEVISASFHNGRNFEKIFKRSIRLNSNVFSEQQQPSAFNDNNNENRRQLIRLNKVFKATHSRREADKIIKEGRVSVNGDTSLGCMVIPYRDVVELDGHEIEGWEKMNGLTTNENDISSSSIEQFEYVKYWKPRGVICTTDQRIKGNIIDDITLRSGYKPEHRVYPVGRLDKDSSGLILITSDGRLPNASLRGNEKRPKVYQVYLDRPIVGSDIDLLQQGIVITTVAQRDGKSKPLTAKTKPCLVKQITRDRVEITLTEGRNRQIRKMMDALGYRVIDLHRIRFGMIDIRDMVNPGDWKRLNKQEMIWIKSVVSD